MLQPINNPASAQEFGEHMEEEPLGVEMEGFGADTLTRGQDEEVDLEAENDEGEDEEGEDEEGDEEEDITQNKDDEVKYDLETVLELDGDDSPIVSPPKHFILDNNAISSPLRRHKLNFRVDMRRISTPSIDSGGVSLQATTQSNMTHEVVPSTVQVHLQPQPQPHPTPLPLQPCQLFMDAISSLFFS